EAIEPDERAARRERAVVLGVVDAVRVPDDQPFRRHALAGHDVDLVVAARGLLGVRDQRHAGLTGSAGAGSHELALVLRDLVRAGRDLHRARADPGLTDPFGDLLYIDGGDLLDREVAERIGDAFRLEVRPRGAD